MVTLARSPFFGRDPDRDSSNPSRGVTLLELLASLTLSSVIGLLAFSLYRQSRATANTLFSRGQEQFQSRAFSELMAGTVIQGSGLRALHPQGLDIVSRDGRLMRFAIPWGDSVLTLGGKPVWDSICDFKADVSGRKWENKGWMQDKPASDSLDSDGDGQISFAEMDANGDGALDTLELPLVRLIELTWRECGRENPKHRLILSPRNRVGPRPQESGDLTAYDF